ncbi:MAG: hypothetical protein A3F90_02555 [Deltaproteobacteria bacterium RIFCSPLOWO2_12_FULL_60_19]|nr:MAG: hypothetical protein A3F90_02555 [Deltaproteobacteria bacterium RIFCSPLOWO2_12_FULL_60_19]
MSVEIRNLTKVFGVGEKGVFAVRGVSLTVEKGAFLTLLGPSGCGKTTTLRCLAGLERPDEGEIILSGQVVVSTSRGIYMPVNQRPIGMVFQSYAIWPHMTVFRNVAYPLQSMGIAKGEIRRRVEHCLELVGLGRLEQRLAPNLSGGEQQRVALARALVMEPEVLLLDEPLSNLDAKLREGMRVEIRRLQRQLGITTVYVTHDQVEALSMSDMVGVMHNGRLVELDTPRGVYERPRTRFGAEFIGTANLVRGRRSGLSEGGWKAAETELGTLCYASPGCSEPAGEEVDFLIRPEDICVSPHSAAGPESNMPNRWRGEVTQAIFLGPDLDCEVSVSGVRLRARLTRSHELKAGDQVDVCIDPQNIKPLMRY